MNVLVVDDSALIRSILKHVLQSGESDIKIIGEAANGERAIELNQRLKPDLIIMDIKMPIMDGLEATNRIMQENPANILIFSNALDSASSFKALNYGACEVMKKPEIDKFNDPEFYKNFIFKLTELGKLERKMPAPKKHVHNVQVNGKNIDYDLIVIGASTGGPATILKLFKALPKNLPVGIALVQHLEEGFDESYAEWLNSESELTVKLAGNNVTPSPGEVLVAPANRHIVVRDDKIFLDDGPKVLNQKPSVDVLFESASQNYQNRLIGVLLTGMGTDGANGCVKIKQNRGFTIVQDKSTATIFGMPKAAIEKGGASQVLPLNEIPEAILKLLGT